MTPAARLLQAAAFALLVRPGLRLVLGLRVENRAALPLRGPAVIVANHNSHLDTLVLMSLFPLSRLHRVRPAAAADHFLRDGLLSWIARRVLRIIPIERTGKGAEEALAPVRAALARAEIVIFYPEGTRGEPEILAKFRRGISVLATAAPAVPILPVYLHSLGKCLPKGEALLVPFFCDVIVGTPEDLAGVPAAEIPERLQARILDLSRRSCLARWDESGTAATPGNGLASAASHDA
jgi:1-acyl-sn-glycerol-3-phosphate acyltransferase